MFFSCKKENRYDDVDFDIEKTDLINVYKVKRLGDVSSIVSLSKNDNEAFILCDNEQVQNCSGDVEIVVTRNGEFRVVNKYNTTSHSNSFIAYPFDEYTVSISELRIVDSNKIDSNISIKMFFLNGNEEIGLIDTCDSLEYKANSTELVVYKNCRINQSSFIYTNYYKTDERFEEEYVSNKIYFELYDKTNDTIHSDTFSSIHPNKDYMSHEDILIKLDSNVLEYKFPNGLQLELLTRWEREYMW